MARKKRAPAPDVPAIWDVYQLASGGNIAVSRGPLDPFFWPEGARYRIGTVLAMTALEAIAVALRFQREEWKGYGRRGVRLPNRCFTRH